jgi:hypothetical protein
MTPSVETTGSAGTVKPRGSRAAARGDPDADAHQDEREQRPMLVISPTMSPG